MKKRLLLFVLSVFAIQMVSALDIIIQKNNDSIFCKIKEIGLVEIKYLLPDKSQDIVFVIARDDVTKVVFENGKEMTFKQEMTDRGNYTDNKQNAIKVDLFAPLLNTSFEISYEHSLGPGKSWEGSLGIIGLGDDVMEISPKGVYTKFGYKFIKSPDFYLRGMRYAHILKGSYIKPEVALSVFSYTPKSYDYFGSTQSGNRKNVIGGAVQIVFGKQWVYNNRIAVDTYWGVGYGISDVGDSNKTQHYAFQLFGKSFPLAMSYGIRLGLLF